MKVSYLDYVIIKENLTTEFPFTIEKKDGIFIDVARTLEEAKQIIKNNKKGIIDINIGIDTLYNIPSLPIENNTIQLTPLAYQKLCYYADARPQDEISGLGEVIKNKNQYLITEVYCLYQQSDSGGTKLDKTDIARLQAKIIAQGRTPNNLRVWWHTHGDRDTFWSQTDETNINNFACDKFMVSIVMTSIHHKMLGRIDFYKPTRQVIEEIQPTIFLKEDNKLKQQCFEEARKKNRRMKYAGITIGKNKLCSSARFIKSQISLGI